ncbi:MAG: hypothetical protein U0792_24390 [Gemmataceae bacterium]
MKHSPEQSKQIEMACRLVWGRGPTDAEAKLFGAYAEKHGMANLAACCSTRTSSSSRTGMPL